MLWIILNALLSFQVLQSGATECPTKPKGRPRKDSYLPSKPKETVDIVDKLNTDTATAERLGQSAQELSEDTSDSQSNRSAADEPLISVTDDEEM